MVKYAKGDKLICMVICFYDGPRSGEQEEVGIENYIEMHRKCLEKYEHNLDEVFFVISEDDRKEIEVLRHKGDKISYIYRPNFGLSFGGWADTYDMFKDEFDYFICCEDDYLFVKDNFDQIMVDEYEKKQCQYMVSFAEPGDMTLAAHFWKNISTVGILSSRNLPKFNWNEFKVPKGNEHHYTIVHGHAPSWGAPYRDDSGKQSVEDSGFLRQQDKPLVAPHDTKGWHMGKWLASFSDFRGCLLMSDGHGSNWNTLMENALTEEGDRCRGNPAMIPEAPLRSGISCLSHRYSCFLYWNWKKKYINAFDWDGAETQEKNLERVIVACYQWVSGKNTDLRIPTGELVGGFEVFKRI